MSFDAAIIDIDGVLTRTAALHEEAWKQLFNFALLRWADEKAFSHEEYQTFIYGKFRLKGLREFLGHRGIQPEPEEANALADEKSVNFVRLVRERGVELYPDTVELVRAWRRNGLGIAFVSCSLNARLALEASGLTELCDVLVDGLIARELGLDSKLAILREATFRLDAEPPKILAIDDSVDGVAAAVRAGFGLVVGVARDQPRPDLAEAGAQRTVQSLNELKDLAVVEPGSRRTSELSSALRLDLAKTWLGERRPVVFLDFDGTLCPIVSDPHQANLADATREVVRALSMYCAIGIISGRDRADLERRINLPGLWYVGSHGFDIASPDGLVVSPPGTEQAVIELDQAEASLRQELASKPGLVIERKRFGLAVHYRAASQDDGALAIQRVGAWAHDESSLRVRVGERVIELRPAIAWDKGRAVEYLLRVMVPTGLDTIIAPVYIGDGHTDEDAFRVLKEYGLTILVGTPLRPTHANLQLADPYQVQVFLEQLTGWLRRRGVLSDWSLRYDEWQPDKEGLREALCTLGNGHFATRGAAEESSADNVHYPGTYIAAGYDRIVTEIQGRVLINEDLVNWPNWLPLSFRPKGGEWLSLDLFEVRSFEQELDLHSGVLCRKVQLRDRDGRETALSCQRIVSMNDSHVAAVRWKLVPENWSGVIEFRTSIDGTVCNSGVKRYQKLRGQHLIPAGRGSEGDTIWLAMSARQSTIMVAMVARTQVVGTVNDMCIPRESMTHVDRVEQKFGLNAEQGGEIVIEKVVTLYSSRDHATSNPIDDSREHMRGLPVFDQLLSAHQRKWAHLWRRCDINLGGGQEDVNRILRLHIFHLLQVVSPHLVGRDAGVPARGLHGEAYRGHIFWDELFVLPFLTSRLPEMTRQLLMYRYRRLPAARRLAGLNGYQGAVFPWQSGSTGQEESQLLHINPRSGRWVPDETHLQRHINAAIAWNVWQYYETTGDNEFLGTYGAEMLVEIARFWASLATWDESLERYRICGIVGPDEFHTSYPGADRLGIDDNAYTNIMAAWCLRCVERALDDVGEDRRRELLEELQVTDAQRRQWARVAQKLRVVFFPDGRVISQFDGYADLKELDWESYRSRYGDIHRLDRILEAEGDNVGRYQISKQADVLMLLYLFSGEELARLLEAMGYSFDPAWIPENIDYYLKRTSDGSTLSRVVHSWVLARSDRRRSFRLFKEALLSDVADIQGGTTAEGIHLGAMAGTVDLLQRGYTGAVVRDGILWLDPRLPHSLAWLRLRYQVRGAWIDLLMTQQEVDVGFSAGHAPLARVGIAGRVHELQRGERRRFPVIGAEAQVIPIAINMI